jgi:MFS family permease
MREEILATVCQWLGCLCSRTVSHHGNADVKAHTRSYAGYANSVIGSIVANQGFIDQYGTVRDPQTGKLALNATHISLWGALYFVTAICIQTVAPYTADRFGRKFNMWGITFFITVVSLEFVVLIRLSDITLSLSSSSASPKHGGRS